MKQIKIQSIIPPNKSSHYIKDNMYSILLGNDHREYFKNIKPAKRFLAETNRFLNSKLHECNYLYYSLFTEFRRIWFFFNSEDPKRAKELRRIEDIIENCFNSIDKAINLLVNRSHYTNGNYFTWHHFYNLIDYYMDIIEQIKRVLCIRKYHIDLKRIEIFEQQAVKLKTELMNYGKATEI